MNKILVLFDSATGNVQQMADLVGEGAALVPDTEVRMRRVDDQIFTAFDFPDCGQIRAKRPVSTTPLQALNLMNSDFVVEQSKFVAERAQKESEGSGLKAAVRRCFALLLTRQPDADELATAVQVAEKQGLHVVCRGLINANEFVCVDQLD